MQALRVASASQRNFEAPHMKYVFEMLGKLDQTRLLKGTRVKSRSKEAPYLILPSLGVDYTNRAVKSGFEKGDFDESDIIFVQGCIDPSEQSRISTSKIVTRGVHNAVVALKNNRDERGLDLELAYSPDIATLDASSPSTLETSLADLHRNFYEVSEDKVVTAAIVSSVLSKNINKALQQRFTG